MHLQLELARGLEHSTETPRLDHTQVRDTHTRTGHLRFSEVLHELKQTPRGQKCVERLLQELVAIPDIRLFELELDLRPWHPERSVIPELVNIKSCFDISRAAELVSTPTLVYWIAERIKGSAPDLLVATERLKSQAVSQSIESLSLNVFGMPRWAGGKNHRRFAEIAKELSSTRFQRTDVVALQEMWHPKTKLIIERSDFSFHAKTRELKGVIGSNGLVTLSRHPILTSQTFEFTRRPSIERFVKKGALFCRIQMPSGLLVDVWNVHMTSTSSLLSEKSASLVRRQQIEELAKWNERVSLASVPRLVMGDMNTREDCSEYRELCSAFGIDIFRKHHQLDHLPASTADDFRRHYHHGYTFDPERNPIAKNPDGAPERLDYQFAAGFAGTLAFESRLDLRVDCKVRQPLSDHAAVWSRLNILKGRS